MSGTDLYENLLKATDNTNDITNEKYGTITSINNNLCNVKEEDADIEHLNVPVLNEITLKLGDKVIIGFIQNSIYNPIILGVIGRDVIHEMEIDLNNVKVDFDYNFGLSGIDDSITINPFLVINE